MRTSLSIIGLLTLGIVCETHSAAAQGAEAGIRTGYAVPLGKATGDATKNMSEGIRAAIPIWIDLGERVTPNFFVGFNGQYDFGFLGDTYKQACDAANASCSTHVIRLGIEAHYHFLPTSHADPWLGLGIGYEWWLFSSSSNGKDTSITASGPEFANLQVGLDLKPTAESATAVGPFASFSLSQYSDVSCSGTIGCSDVNSKSIHNWFIVGVRGVLGP